MTNWADFKANVTIAEFVAANGYELVRRDGLKWPVFRHQTTDDEIIVNPKGTFYFDKRNDAENGTLIDFI